MKSSSSSSSSSSYVTNIFGGHSPDYVTFDLDMSYLREIQFFCKTVPTVKHCVETLDKFLFSDFRIKGAKPVLQTYVSEYFIPFFRQCLKKILMIGWVLYRTVKTKDPRSGQNIVIPELIPLDYVQVQLRVNKKTFEHELLCFELNSMEPIKNARFIIFSDLQRLAENNLVDSVLDTIMGDFRYVQQIKRFTMQAEYVRSNPTIFLRAAEGRRGEVGAATNTGTMKRSTSVGLAPESREGASLTKRLARKLPKQQEALEKASEEVSSNVEFHNSQMASMNYKQSQSWYTLGLGLRPQYEDNLYILPPNTVLAAPPHMPESRVDQLVIERDLMTKIYQAFGIPETVAGFSGGSNNNSTSGSSSKSSKVRTDVNMMDIITFESTLDRLKLFFMDSFALVYEEIFNKVIPKNSVQFFPPKIYELYIKSVVFGSVQGATEEVTREGAPDGDKPHDSDKNSPGPKAKEPDGGRGAGSGAAHGKDVDQVVRDEEKLAQEAAKEQDKKKAQDKATVQTGASKKNDPKDDKKDPKDEKRKAAKDEPKDDKKREAPKKRKRDDDSDDDSDSEDEDKKPKEKAKKKKKKTN